MVGVSRNKNIRNEIAFHDYLASGVSRGVFWLPGNPPPLPAMIFFNQGGDTVTGTDLHLPLHLRVLETPLETNSGYATARIYITVNHACAVNNMLCNRDIFNKIVGRITYYTRYLAKYIDGNCCTNETRRLARRSSEYSFKFVLYLTHCS